MKRAALIPAGLMTAVLVFASGGNPGPSFQPGSFPEDETQFEAGKLGLITPALDKRFELLAFRSLSGLTIVAPGKKAAVLGDGSYSSPVQTWLKVSGSAPNTFLITFKSSSGPPNVYYENCLEDAFLTATKTLADRRGRYHNQAEFQGWVEAQQQVFANCGSEKKPTYPAEPGSNVSALAHADRRYQIAAAHFYAEDFDAAENLFRAIAADQTSPWQKTGEYMIGRTLLREVSLRDKSAAANAAREQFRKVAADPTAGGLRDSARGLLEHLDAIEHSGETFNSLAKRIMEPRPDSSFKASIEESRYVLLADSFRSALSQPDVAEPFDWVKTLENGDEAHAVERWRAQSSLPWLPVALIHASGNDPAAAELIEKADGVPAGSPAFVTASYNAIRLRMERGEKDGPRRQLDRLLASKASQPASVLNAWRAERMRLATTFDDFLRWAPRTPVDGEQASPVLAEDSIRVLNYLTPLPLLVKAAHSARLPQWSAADVALAAWTRAFILNDAAVMSELAEGIGRAHPNWAVQLKRQPGEEWRFHTAVLIGRNSEFDPVLVTDYRRHTAPHHWWCAVKPPVKGEYQTYAAWRLPVQIEPGDAGISPAEARKAAKEIERLNQPVPSVIGPIILAWAKSHPDDPLVPEALHRVVSVVRYGCPGQPDDGALSKAAFDLLHKKYPKNEWTTKTRYWFK